jgi:hypothetical protein
MEDLKVDPKYLTDWAVRQDDAATEMANGVSGVAGTAKELWYDHGVICGGTALSMEASEGERERAGNTMQAVSLALAENLRVAAKKYAKTDTQASDVIDQQVVPG